MSRRQVSPSMRTLNEKILNGIEKYYENKRSTRTSSVAIGKSGISGTNPIIFQLDPEPTTLGLRKKLEYFHLASP